MGLTFYIKIVGFQPDSRVHFFIERLRNEPKKPLSAGGFFVRSGLFLFNDVAWALWWLRSIVVRGDGLHDSIQEQRGGKSKAKRTVIPDSIGNLLFFNL